MPPKRPTATSSKRSTTSKQARVNDPAPKHTQNPVIPPFRDRLSPANQKWITDRGHLKMIVEKSFDEHVTENLNLTTLFGNMGW